MADLQRNESHLTKVGSRSVSTSGFRMPAAIEHLRQHLEGATKWCTIGCMARTMYARNTEQNRLKIRQTIRKLFHELLGMGEFLAVDYESSGRRRITAVKLYEGVDESERQCAERQLDVMRKRGEVTGKSLAHAQQILGL